MKMSKWLASQLLVKPTKKRVKIIFAISTIQRRKKRGANQMLFNRNAENGDEIDL